MTLKHVVDDEHVAWVDHGFALFQRVDEPVAISYGSGLTDRPIILINWETAVNDLSSDYRPNFRS